MAWQRIGDVARKIAERVENGGKPFDPPAKSDKMSEPGGATNANPALTETASTVENANDGFAELYPIPARSASGKHD